MLTVAAIMLAVALPAEKPQSETDYLRLRREFLERETKLMSAIQQDRNDVLALLLAKDFSVTMALENKPAQVFSPSEWMRMDEQYAVRHYEIQDLGVHDSPPVAIVSFRALRTGQPGGAGAGAPEYQITDIWIEQGKAWKLRRRLISRPMALNPHE